MILRSLFSIRFKLIDARIMMSRASPISKFSPMFAFLLPPTTIYRVFAETPAKAQISSWGYGHHHQPFHKSLRKMVLFCFLFYFSTLADQPLSPTAFAASHHCGTPPSSHHHSRLSTSSILRKIERTSSLILSPPLLFFSFISLVDIGNLVEGI